MPETIGKTYVETMFTNDVSFGDKEGISIPVMIATVIMDFIYYTVR